MKNMKKIIGIIGGSLVAILLVVTIILACTTHTAYKLDIAKPSFIEIYKGSETAKLTVVKDNVDDEEVYNKIISLYNKSFKENNLSALFQGAKGFKKEVKNKQVQLSDILNDASGNFILHYRYSNGQQNLKIDGKDYVNPENKSEKVTFTDLYIEVANTANYNEFKVYLAVDPTEGPATESYWQVNLIAHQSDLYTYLSDLTK